jgi:hypothetical protein
MATAVLLTVILVGLGRTVATLQLQLLPGAARCLDNSPAGYYFAPGESGSTIWVINLQGGGSCMEEADCLQRAKGHLGSSRKWPATDSGNKSPFLSPDASKNPGDFHRLNQQLWFVDAD